MPEGERSFYSYFAKIRRATDVTPQHLDLLNLSVSYDVPVEELVGGSTEWIPRDGDGDETWAERQRELLIENSVANEVMARIRRDVKLGHMYKFFQSLEMVAPYYGTPEECVEYAAEQLKKEEEGQRDQHKKQHEAVASAVDKMEIDDSPVPNDNGKRPASEEAAGTAKKDRASPESDADDLPDKVKKEDTFSMPERFRDDLVKNFVEPICWGHGVRVYPPRAAPKLHVRNSKFSIHLNYHIHWTPLDPQEARSGLVDGPVLGMQIRHEHSFRALSDPAAALKKRRKKLMAAALAAKVPPTAEEEAERLKKAEKDKARAERRAKRGGASAAKEEKAEKAIEDEMKEEIEDLGDDGILVLDTDGAALDVVGVTREIAALLSMAQLRSQEGETEKKVRYRAVGKVEGSYWDDVYMVTSLHHHVSISHLRVSKPYLRFLKTGKLPTNLEHPFIKEGGWEKLHLRKTKYYSLMVPEERVKAAREFVTVLKYVTRNEKKPAAGR